MPGNKVYYSTTYDSPVGRLTLCASDDGKLVGLWLAGQKYFGASVSGEMLPNDNAAVFAHVRCWLDKYFAGARPNISDLSLAPQGSEFRRRVWRALCEIPYGQTMTYGDIAAQLASSPRAVGAAVGHNPISIIIPCHRVVGADGTLTGYAGGLNTKEKLLRHEGR